jgi:hypothetical protein
MQKVNERGQAAFKLSASARTNSLAAWLALPAPLQNIYGWGGWIDDYFPDTLSEGDWHLTGCDPDQPDDALMEAIGEVGQLLAHEGSGWHELIAESRRLIVASRLNPVAGKQRWRAVR